jgi:hypothetical protein
MDWFQPTNDPGVIACYAAQGQLEPQPYTDLARAAGFKLNSLPLRMLPPGAGFVDAVTSSRSTIATAIDGRRSRCRAERA